MSNPIRITKIKHENEVKERVLKLNDLVTPPDEECSKTVTPQTKIDSVLTQYPKKQEIQIEGLTGTSTLHENLSSLVLTKKSPMNNLVPNNGQARIERILLKSTNPFYMQKSISQTPDDTSFENQEIMKPKKIGVLPAVKTNKAKPSHGHMMHAIPETP